MSSGGNINNDKIGLFKRETVISLGRLLMTIYFIQEGLTHLFSKNEEAIKALDIKMYNTRVLLYRGGFISSKKSAFEEWFFASS